MADVALSTRRGLITGVGAVGVALSIPDAHAVAMPASAVGLVQVPAGQQRVARPLVLSGGGQFVLSGGGSHVAGIGPGGSLVLGAATKESWFQPLRSGTNQGDHVVRPTSIEGYSPGDIVLLVGGRSRNSSPGNDIPATKQFATIVAIDRDNGELRLATPLENALEPTRHGMVSRAGLPQATATTVQNLRLGATDADGVVYTHAVQSAYVVSIRDCIIEGDAATGFVAFADHVVYDNVAFSGYSGISCARGTRRVVWRDCSYAPRAEHSEGYCAFIEESPESAIIENFRARGGQFKITNSSDDDIHKDVLVRNLDLEFDAIALRDAESLRVPAIEIAFPAGAGSAIRFDGGMVRTPGGDAIAVGRVVPRCAIYIYASRAVRLSGLRFAGLAPDAYAIAVDGTNCFDLEIDDCAIIDGSGRGLCHPSVLANMNFAVGSSTLRRMVGLEVALDQGLVFVTRDAETGELLCRWPAGRSRRIARLTAAGHHVVLIDIAIGNGAQFDHVAARIDILDGVVRAGSGVGGIAPDRVVHAERNGDVVDLTIAVPGALPWRGSVRYIQSAAADGRGMTIA